MISTVQIWSNKFDQTAPTMNGPHGQQWMDLSWHGWDYISLPTSNKPFSSSPGPRETIAINNLLIIRDHIARKELASDKQSLNF
jgi:hypothetical protein